MFDGSCPLCRREIALYQSLVPLQTVHWRDISGGGTGLCAEDQTRYLSRLHVQALDGSELDGAEAFVALWLALPGWRWLGQLGRLPGFVPLLEWCYTHFLRVRPRLQTWARAAEVGHLPADMVAELRSDHAGETGAVALYRGILWGTRDPVVQAFALRHLRTELEHLEVMNALVPRLRRSWLLPIWRVAGFFTGALPAIAGKQAVFATVAAVETFVDQHYQQQIDKLAGRSEAEALLQLITACHRDELDHLEEASNQVLGHPGWGIQLWCKAVDRGSVAGVWLARRL